MKKTIAIAMLLAATTTGAFAQQGGFNGPSDAPTATVSPQGGFSGPSDALVTVEQAKTLRDDSKIILRGNIERQISGKHYLFRDQTGTIEIEISHKKWRGLTVTPQDLVEIAGEVDKDFRKLEIDVDYIKKVN